MGTARAQGLYASLELLPMWAGIEPDVQLFASGRVLDDDGEWAGGQSLGSDGSGGAAAPAPPLPCCLLGMQHGVPPLPRSAQCKP